jgi:23S rRNA pseudouridine1911/1915/1917 synthase
MPKEKAYKLLALQEGISNKKAKELIDRGIVYVGNKKVQIARGEIDTKTTFRVEKLQKPTLIYEDENLVVVDKPPFVNSDEIQREFKGTQLLHRLDRETSGVLMLVKNEEFRQKAIEEFKKDRVYKEYVAWVEGIIPEEVVIDRGIITTKKGNKAHSNVSPKGKPAITEVYPLEVASKKTKVKCIIHHGRTHQIRTHLRYIEHPIIGDVEYGGRKAKRVMLHAKKVKLLDKEFVSNEPKIFSDFQ